MAIRDEYGFKLGDHLVSSRVFYDHHGIYVGDGKVIHYAGLSDGFSSAPVETTSLADFAQGHDIEVQKHRDRVYGRKKTVKRARRRLGEDEYSVFSKNCEHFANWCIEGEERSEQVERAASFVCLSVGIVRALS